jgi:hypothetical protein
VKKYLLALAGLLPLAAHAQFGVRAGVHSTRWSSGGRPSNSTYARTTPHLGYQVGLTYQVPLVGHLSLVPELSYSYENLELSADSYGYGYNFYGLASQLKLSYLTLPVMERVTFGPVYAEVGPQLSLLVGGREIGSEITYRSSSPIITDIDRPAAERYHRLDIGVCAGLGVQLPMGLGLGLRFVQGIRSLTQDYAFGQGYDGEIRSRSLQASLTYRLKKAS